MTSLEEVQDQLHALIAGTLSPGEADALQQRITSDPVVARAYAEAMLEAEQQLRSDECCGPMDASCDGETRGTGETSMFRRFCRMLGGNS